MQYIQLYFVVLWSRLAVTSKTPAWFVPPTWKWAGVVCGCILHGGARAWKTVNHEHNMHACMCRQCLMLRNYGGRSAHHHRPSGVTANARYAQRVRCNASQQVEVVAMVRLHRQNPLKSCASMLQIRLCARLTFIHRLNLINYPNFFSDQSSICTHAASTSYIIFFFFFICFCVHGFWIW